MTKSSVICLTRQKLLSPGAPALFIYSMSGYLFFAFNQLIVLDRDPFFGPFLVGFPFRFRGL